MDNMIGKEFNRLTVIEFYDKTKGGSKRYICKCSCGTKRTHPIVGSSIKFGSTKSCGCLGREKLKEHREKHGFANSKVYESWRKMIKRCSDPNHPQWNDYGGRGITYHPDFNDINKFYKYMGDPPDGMTLDRIKNNEGYTYGNMRWTNRTTQQRNRRKVKNSTSNYYGVFLDKSRKNKKWICRIWLTNNSAKNIGRFVNEIDAAKAYDRATIEYKTGAQLNFPEDYQNF